MKSESPFPHLYHLFPRATGLFHKSHHPVQTPAALILGFTVSQHAFVSLCFTPVPSVDEILCCQTIPKHV